MRFDVHRQYVRIIAALAVRELSHEEHNAMRAKMYELPVNEETLFIHDDATCPFREEMPTVAQMNNAMLSSPGSGKKIEKFGRISI